MHDTTNHIRSSVGTAEGKFSLGSFGNSLSESTLWVVLIYGLVMNVGNFAIDQSYVQRYITASSDREAKKSVWLTALLYVPVAAIFFSLAPACLFFTTPGRSCWVQASKQTKCSRCSFPKNCRRDWPGS